MRLIQTCDSPLLTRSELCKKKKSRRPNIAVQRFVSISGILFHFNYFLVVTDIFADAGWWNSAGSKKGCYHQVSTHTIYILLVCYLKSSQKLLITCYVGLDLPETSIPKATTIGSTVESPLQKRCITLVLWFSRYNIWWPGNDDTAYWKISDAFTKHLCITDQNTVAQEMVDDYIFESHQFGWRTTRSPGWHVLWSRSFRYHSSLTVQKSSWDWTLTIRISGGESS